MISMTVMSAWTHIVSCPSECSYQSFWSKHLTTRVIRDKTSLKLNDVLREACFVFDKSMTKSMRESLPGLMFGAFPNKVKRNRDTATEGRATNFEAAHFVYYNRSATQVCLRCLEYAWWSLTLQRPQECFEILQAMRIP